MTDLEKQALIPVSALGYDACREHTRYRMIPFIW
jgi:hypothetical protein